MSGTDITQEQWRDLRLSVKTHLGRRRLSPCEVAELITLALHANSAHRVAENLGFKDATMVSRFQALYSLPAAVQAMIDWRAGSGSVSMSTASQLARIRNRPGGASDQDIEAAFRAVIEHGLTSKEARDLAQAYLRGSGDIAEALTAVLRSRPRLERHHVILGAITSATAQARLATMSAPERQNSIEESLARLFPNVKFDAVRVASNHFVLVLTEKHFHLLQDTLKGDSLEKRIELALQAE
jgi:hypothetical protein